MNLPSCSPLRRGIHMINRAERLVGRSAGEPLREWSIIVDPARGTS